jgi:hypothetical protein
LRTSSIEAIFPNGIMSPIALPSALVEAFIISDPRVKLDLPGIGSHAHPRAGMRSSGVRYTVMVTEMKV